MRLIGHLDDATYAVRLGGVLHAQGIDYHLEQNPNGRWEIWVLDEAHIDAAKSLFARFIQSPDDPAFVQAAQTATLPPKTEQPTGSGRRFRAFDGRTVFYSPLVPLGFLSVTLIAVSFGVSLLTNFGQNDRFVQPLSITQYHREGDYITSRPGLPEIRRGQIWRLFTPMFLHFNLLHLLFNMLWLRDLGSMIEARKGPLMLLILVAVIAAISNLAQFYRDGPMFGGMSGVVYGLFGYIWMQSRFNPRSGMRLQEQTVVMMIVWFFLCLTGLVGAIANVAHAVGLATGIAWGFLSARLPTILHRPPRL